MTDPISSKRPVERQWAVILLATFLFAVGVAGALGRKALVPLLVLTCLALLGFAGNIEPKAIFRRTPTMVAAAAVAVWAAVTNFWGFDLHFVFLAQAAITIALVIFGARMIAALPETVAARLDRWMIAGSVFLVVFLIEEKISGARITTWLHPDPGLQITAIFFPKIFVYAGGGAPVLATTCCAVATLIYARTRSLVWPVLYFIAALIACAVMPMTAATLGVVLGGAAFVAAYYFRRLTFAVIFAGFAAYLILAPAVSLFLLPSRVDPIPTASASDVATNDFSGEDVISIQARFATWRHVSDLIMERPCFGHGFGASRDFSGTNERLPGSVLPAIPIHPHNGPLQVWLELGLVGVVLVLGVLATAWRATAGLWQRPLAAAVVAGTLVASSVPILVSFSLWNTWWLATLGFAAMFAVRAVKAS